jgi:hypothetical protein
MRTDSGWILIHRDSDVDIDIFEKDVLANMVWGFSTSLTQMSALVEEGTMLCILPFITLYTSQEHS